MDILELKVRATALTTEDVIILRISLHSTRNIAHRDVLDDHAIAWVACWSAVKVILLDVDAVDGDVFEGDVGV